MGNFKQDRRSSNRRDFGDRPTMHSAVCSKCGKNCEVPFQPRGDKPIFCQDCFVRPARSDNHSQSSQSPQIKEQLDSINAKLDKILARLPNQQPESKRIES